MCVCVLIYIHTYASQVVLMVKNPPANARDVREDMATHSSILA